MKTAKELGIEQWMYDRLLDVRDKLVNGEIQYADNWWLYNNNDEGKPLPSMGFNMDIATSEGSDCGSACCIGGWMYALQYGVAERHGDKVLMRYDQEAASDFVGDMENYNEALHFLFYPPNRYEYELIQPAHAVAAINNYLNHGKASWEEVLPESLLYVNRL
jgi:hypothetical protein